MHATPRRRHARRDRMITQINFVPFTDVLLVLLVIFMMTATILGNEGGLEMRLPRVASAEAQGEQPEGGCHHRAAGASIDDEATASGDLVHRWHLPPMTGGPGGDHPR